MTTAPAHGIMVCLYHLPRVCRTLVPKIRVCPENAQGIPVYWRAHVHDFTTACTRLNSKEDWSYSCMSAVKIIDEDRWVNAQTHGINWLSLLRQWSWSCPATCQRACVNQKWPMSCFVKLLFCDVHIDKGAKLNLLHCLHVICGCRAIQTKDTTDTATYVPIVTIIIKNTKVLMPRW